MARYYFVIKQGETFSEPIQWKDSAGHAINLTGYTAVLNATSRGVCNPTAAFTLSTANGKITIATTTMTLLLSAAQSAALVLGDYDYTLVITSPGGVVKRLLDGLMRVV